MKLTIAFDEYKPWSGAISTYERIKEEDRLEELEQLMDELNPDGVMSETELNDMLWFNSEYIMEQLGLAEDEDEDEE